MDETPHTDTLPWNGSDGSVLSERARQRISEFLTDTPEVVNPIYGPNNTSEFVLGDGITLEVELDRIGTLNDDRYYYAVNLELFVDHETPTQKPFLHEWNDWGETLTDDIFSLLRDIYVGDGEYGPGSNEEFYMLAPTNTSPSLWVASLRVPEEHFIPPHKTVTVELSASDTTELNIPQAVVAEARSSDDTTAVIERYVRDVWVETLERGQLLRALGFEFGVSPLDDDADRPPYVTLLDED